MMSSQSGMAIASPQVFVNKAAKKIVIERKANGREPDRKDHRQLVENSSATNAKIPNDDKISGSPNEDLEEGEIDADIPTTSTAIKKLEIPASKRESVATPAIVISEPPSINDNSSADGEQNSVQKKLTALERLKSLNFASPKSAVNPFTLATPKPPTTTPADYKNDKKHARPAPSFQQSPAPSKKQRSFPEHQANRMPFHENRHSRHGGRLNADPDLGSSRTPMAFNRNFRHGEAISRHENFLFSSADSFISEKPSQSWIPPNEQPISPRHLGFDDELPPECRFSPQPPPPVVETAPANDFVQEDMASTSAVCWEKVRELTITPEELNNWSVNDLRTIVQYLLDEETELIQLHLRFQDQMKNVRRTLDREKQIEQLKKQALIASAAAKKAAKETAETNLPKSNKKPPIPTVDEDHRNELVKEEPEKEENHYNGRVDFEDAFAQALTKSILEQAAARKAHLVQYVTASSAHYASGSTYDTRHPQSSHYEQSVPSSVSKEKFLTMLTSFFDGVASMNDRSLFRDDTPT